MSDGIDVWSRTHLGMVLFFFDVVADDDDDSLMMVVAAAAAWTIIGRRRRHWTKRVKPARIHDDNAVNYYTSYSSGDDTIHSSDDEHAKSGAKYLPADVRTVCYCNCCSQSLHCLDCRTIDCWNRWSMMHLPYDDCSSNSYRDIPFHPSGRVSTLVALTTESCRLVTWRWGCDDAKENGGRAAMEEERPYREGGRCRGLAAELWGSNVIFWEWGGIDWGCFVRWGWMDGCCYLVVGPAWMVIVMRSGASWKKQWLCSDLCLLYFVLLLMIQTATATVQSMVSIEITAISRNRWGYAQLWCWWCCFACFIICRVSCVMWLIPLRLVRSSASRYDVVSGAATS